MQYWHSGLLLLGAIEWVGFAKGITAVSNFFDYVLHAGTILSVLTFPKIF